MSQCWWLTPGICGSRRHSASTGTFRSAKASAMAPPMKPLAPVTITATTVPLSSQSPASFSSAGIRTPVPPPRFALAQERVDPLLRVDGDRIVRHHLRHPLIGLVHRQLPLLVECRLPYGNCSRRDRRDPMGQGLGGVFELVVVDDVGDETEV